MWRIAIAVLLTLCPLLSSCNDDDGVVEPAKCTNRNEPDISPAGTPEHEHKLQGALCEEDRGNGVLVPLTSPDHTHEYLIREDDVNKILDGQWFGTETSRALDHRHVIIYNPR